MKRKTLIAGFLALLSLAGVVHAQPIGISPPYTGEEFANTCGFSQQCGELAAALGSSSGTLTPDADNTYDLGTSSAAFRSAYIDTSVEFGTGAYVNASTTSQWKFGAAAVITPATTYPTPAAGNTLSNRRTILAAGAPTLAAVVLPLPTISIGKTYTLYNQGSNPVLIAPNTGAVINVDAALTPFSCATLKECECSNTLAAGTSWWCTAK